MDQEKLDRLLIPKAKKCGISLTFNDAPDLLDAINNYRLNLGWTWKRMVLIGAANSIIKSGQNLDLAHKIADYLEVHR